MGNATATSEKVDWKVQLFKLNYDHQEVEAAMDVIESGWITMGEKTMSFEESFAEFLGQGAYCTATSSGTAALHMALLAAGIGPGDEVIVPSLTFVADINVVRLVGASPVLVDCTSYDDWNISPEGIAAAVTPRTKAILVVHYAGYVCDMDAIEAAIHEASDGRTIYLIEDAAHAPGADHGGRACGTIGHVGCFSFFTNKNLSVGEGGMFVTRSKELHEKGRYLRSHGMTALTLDRHKGRSTSYDVILPGLNYRMDEIRAAIGLVQLAKLPEANRRRMQLVEYYRALLRSTPGLHVPFHNHTLGKPSYHIFPILLDKAIDRAEVIAGLKEHGIQSSIHYPPFQGFTAYSSAGLSPTPIATDVSHRELTLPLFPTMTFAQVELVCSTLQRLLD
ncbi:MAG: DegT/DnrJ/EryC1/StrS family aminotransferase [Planctomycetaceae bacterium]|nr:MAG: DegT/DnrJ/EryC1/StrS family aminotransferase [Planctomycetaceae bacterium]